MGSQLTRRKQVALSGLLVGSALTILSLISLITIWPGTLFFAGESELTIRPDQSTEISIRPWYLPPTTGQFGFTTEAHGQNVTTPPIPPFLDFYFESIDIAIIFVDTMGNHTTIATIDMSILFEDQENIFEGSATQTTNPIHLPSLSGLLLNASGSNYSQITLTVRWQLFFTPLEHHLAMGILFAGVAVLTQSIFTLLEETKPTPTPKTTPDTQ